MSRRILAVASAIALTTTMASTGSAQSKVQVTPIIGVYAPSKALVMDSASSSIFETESAALFGLRIGYWFSPRLAVEGGVAISPTRTDLFASSGTTTQLKFRSSAKLADLRLLYLLSQPGAPTGFHITAGAAYTRASNGIFDLSNELGQLHFKTSIGGVVGLGVTRRLAAGTSLRVDVEDRIYKADFEGTGIDIKARTQQDFVFSTGISIGI